MSRGRKLLFVVGACVLGLALAEGAARLALWIGGVPYSKAETQEAIGIAMQSYREALPVDAAEPRDDARHSPRAVADPVPEKAGARAENAAERSTLPHPYYGFERNTRKLHNAIGGLLVEPAKNEYRVVLFGGSVALGFFNRARDAFEEQLESTPELAGRDVVLVKYAHAGFKQPQQASALGYLLSLGVHVDAVLEIDGVNEVALGAMNAEAGAHPLFPAIAQWSAALPASADSRVLDALLDMRAAERRAQRAGDLSMRFGLANSAVLGKFALALQQRMRQKWVAAYERRDLRLARLATEGRGAVLGPPRTGRESTRASATLQSDAGDTWRDELDRIVRGWFEASRSMAALCDARGIAYLHVLQPTLHDRGSKVLTEIERVNGAVDETWVDATELGYPKLREAGRRLAQIGVPFLDASQVFRDVRETLYYDHCHFGDDGNRILAERIVPEIVQSIRTTEGRQGDG